MSRSNARRIARLEKESAAQGEHARKGVPAEFTQAERGVRLQKAMADAGFAARRQCEEAILHGRVSVNNQAVTALPAFVNPAEDTITVDGKALPKPRKAQSAKELRGQTIATTAHDKIAVIFNKPVRVVATTSDPEGRTCVGDLVQGDFPQRLFLAGRLDFESTGLLILTNDGDLAQKLMHPSGGIPKSYVITVRGRVEEEDLEKLRRGVYVSEAPEIKRVRGQAVVRNAPLDPGAFVGELKMKRALIEQVKILRRESSRPRKTRDGSRESAVQETTTLEITLNESQKQDVRRVFSKLGFQVRELRRTAIGPLTLKGVSAGAWRVISTIEMRKLRQAAGL